MWSKTKLIHDTIESIITLKHLSERHVCNVEFEKEDNIDQEKMSAVKFQSIPFL